METAKPRVCSHCQQTGHNKAKCPDKLLPPVDLQPKKDISIHRWNLEKEELLVKMWTEGPLDPDWDAMSAATGITPVGCKKKLYELKSKGEIIAVNSSKLTESQIRQLVQSRKNVCDTCKYVYYTPLSQWKDKMECTACYKIHRTETDKMWIDVNSYLDTIGKQKCSICNRQRFHNLPVEFDHVNMFSKKSSVCTLVYTGASFDTIIQEIQLCELLCASCHQLITILESHIGFIAAKTQITKLLKQQTEELDDKSALDTTQLQTLYASVMPPVYAIAQKITRDDIPKTP